MFHTRILYVKIRKLLLAYRLHKSRKVVGFGSLSLGFLDDTGSDFVCILLCLSHPISGASSL